MLFNQHITDLLSLIGNAGARHVVICPGSRNAPLIQGFQRDPYFSCHSIVDERSAGYVALGMARELNEPVVVLTTSGTATLNLAPAVAEAYHQKIPLLVLTADRPAEYPPQANNQIIDQQEIFIRNSKAFYNIPFEIPDHNELRRVNIEVSAILSLANEDDPGPVHINI
ncbi:MAG: 2-succinyl-5-enolpyruvyl-6-hydroxy-3-cyclohexene-1-carboxylic-acid synthase, partial [Bacteroidales bacterium]|nr:2-succinyl-5-enolpyruvyl-6-hydroxy-3-cyclohexene-1-carboxylic-acid synthase [Bacteroidales bacterium]